MVYFVLKILRKMTKKYDQKWSKKCRPKRCADFSQLRICSPTPLTVAPIFMINSHSAKSNEKSIF